MQFLILATGVLLLVFYQFERTPVFFNSADLRLVEQSPAAAELSRKKTEFDRAFDERRALGLQLLDARERGNETEHQGLLEQYEASSRRAQTTRRDTIKLMRSILGERSTDVNYVYPTFLLTYVPIGILGLMISVIFAAAMSSISAEIAALSSASVVDFYKRYVNKEGTERHYLRAGQFCTAFWGIFATFFATYAGRLGTSLVETVNKVGSHFYGPILGVFLLAFFVKRSNGNGAFVGALVGMIAVAYVSWMTSISWLYYNVVGAVVVVVVGAAVSLLSRRRKP
jgi:Na+(H+)/acetate symporter ActP